MKAFLVKSPDKPLITLTALLLLFYLPLRAQTPLTVSGTVIDSLNAEPLIGASVLAEGTAIGAQTDVKGQFTLTVNKGSALLVKYIGYNEKRIVIGDEVSVVIALSASTKSLTEVVVLAYGSQHKADITAAVSQVDLSKSQGIPVSNVGRLLAGQAAGVVVKQTTGQPGQELQVEIRGNSSLGATSDPLYVVDGFPLGTSVGNSLNANDIESITVLKDAAATSVYGSRGANGVVLITTKKGKKEGFKLSLSANTGMAR
ncbi:MAG: SusC/RagA family TonB-linked outer membrane protein, partial [Candidatus Nephrothrix sp. EaCA]